MNRALGHFWHIQAKLGEPPEYGEMTLPGTGFKIRRLPTILLRVDGEKTFLFLSNRRETNTEL